MVQRCATWFAWGEGGAILDTFYKEKSNPTFSFARRDSAPITIFAAQEVSISKQKQQQQQWQQKITHATAEKLPKKERKEEARRWCAAGLSAMAQETAFFLPLHKSRPERESCNANNTRTLFFIITTTTDCVYILQRDLYGHTTT